jgi:adenylate cyclase
LERADGARVSVAGSLSIGRTPKNQVVLEDERVSRRHAIIHAQGEGEFWLVDLGSRNGTYLGERRVQQPVRLSDGDRIRIASFLLVFRQPSAVGAEETAVQSTQATLAEVRSARCWLLVADVEGSTRLAHAVPPDELAMRMGHWFLHSKQVIEADGGCVNKYLGDGYLAFWTQTEEGPAAVAKAVERLRELQQQSTPPFRFALHLAEVFFGGGASMGEDNLSGPGVNFVFRMEKLAGTLGQGCLLSEPASDALRGLAASEPVGQHALQGFDRLHKFYSLVTGRS